MASIFDKKRPQAAFVFIAFAVLTCFISIAEANEKSYSREIVISGVRYRYFVQCGDSNYTFAQAMSGCASTIERETGWSTATVPSKEANDLLTSLTDEGILLGAFFITGGPVPPSWQWLPGTRAPLSGKVFAYVKSSPNVIGGCAEGEFCDFSDDEITKTSANCTNGGQVVSTQVGSVLIMSVADAKRANKGRRWAAVPSTQCDGGPIAKCYACQKASAVPAPSPAGSGSPLPANPNGWDIFASEFLGTAMLILLGGGVCATNNLAKSKGHGGGWLLITLSWGLAVYMGIYAAWKTGGHLNPAVTIAKVFMYIYDRGVTLNGAVVGKGGIAVNIGNVCFYILGEMVGAMFGSGLVYLTFKTQFDSSKDVDPAAKLGIFSTSPEVRSYLWNCITEVIATFVLITFVAVAGGTPTQVGPLAVSLLVVVIGAALGGPTGYAINPARDLGPRIMHAILPFPGKGPSDWAYAWVPVLAPIVGAILAVVVVHALNLQA